jgi:hypothetical protein
MLGVTEWTMAGDSQRLEVVGQSHAGTKVRFQARIVAKPDGGVDVEVEPPSRWRFGGGHKVPRLARWSLEHALVDMPANLNEPAAASLIVSSNSERVRPSTLTNAQPTCLIVSRSVLFAAGVQQMDQWDFVSEHPECQPLGLPLNAIDKRSRECLDALKKADCTMEVRDVVAQTLSNIRQNRIAYDAAKATWGTAKICCELPEGDSCTWDTEDGPCRPEKMLAFECLAYRNGKIVDCPAKTSGSWDSSAQ